MRAGAGDDGPAWTLTYPEPRTALDQFWQPAIASPRPVVICSPHPVLYGFTEEFRERATGTAGSHVRAQIEPLTLPPDYPMHWKDVVTIRDQYIGMGSAHAIADSASRIGVGAKRIG